MNTYAKEFLTWIVILFVTFSSILIFNNLPIWMIIIGGISFIYLTVVAHKNIFRGGIYILDQLTHNYESCEVLLNEIQVIDDTIFCDHMDSDRENATNARYRYVFEDYKKNCLVLYADIYFDCEKKCLYNIKYAKNSKILKMLKCKL